ncbi:hypothetical protein [Paraburkholderia solisilvae]|uniref:Uncharacterized protein n=1 Tax=Paraburkholderia solisilvae TaxID=624376 RepID=A0A6J5EYL7_9BURK|nr:hypothetical protein [Paraburkholderia solisilvae]CAB3770501.1 hypothetical protein LMG29739_05802 [Paraburkholderia solisilvae]
MANRKLTEEQWEQARDEWERDEDVSYGDIAKKWGISKPAVWQKSQRDKWQKAINPQRRALLGPVVAEGEKRAQSSSRAPDLHSAAKNDGEASESTRTGPEYASEYRIPGTDPVRPGFEHDYTTVQFVPRPTRKPTRKGELGVQYLRERDQLLKDHDIELRYHQSKLVAAAQTSDSTEADRLLKLGRAIKEKQDQQLKRLDEQFNGCVVVCNFYRVPGKQPPILNADALLAPTSTAEPESL